MIYVELGIYYLMLGFSGLITISIILTWIPGLYNYSLFRGIRKLTDTYMEPFQGRLVLGMLDFTPIIGVVLFDFILSAYVYCAS